MEQMVVGCYIWPLAAPWGEHPIAPRWAKGHVSLGLDSNGMRVILRHSTIGLYYAGPKHWVGNADAALDLGSIERAAEMSRAEDFRKMEIVVTYDEPECAMVLPVRRKKRARDQDLRLAA